jgi:uncharacterized protein (TIGR02147 family)
LNQNVRLATGCPAGTEEGSVNHYREILQKEFDDRHERNQRYTLRAYSQFLELNSGTLSAILKGKRKLPRTHAVLCCSKLNLPAGKKRIFMQSLWGEHSLQTALPKDFQQKKFKTLSSDAYFEILSEWEFAAALCLFDIPAFQLTPASLSTVLGLTQKRAMEIYGKLFQYGLILLKDGKIVRSEENFDSSDDVRSRALQMGHRNELQLAIDKLDSVDVKEREFASLTFAGSDQDLKKMKSWLKNMANDFDRQFDKRKANRVFQFSWQLFPLSTRITK